MSILDRSLQVGAIGARLVVVFLDTNGDPIPLDSASSIRIGVKPDATGATAVTKSATLVDGETGKAFIETEAGDIPTAGAWLIQGETTIDGVTSKSEVGRFSVEENVI